MQSKKVQANVAFAKSFILEKQKKLQQKSRW
jgi:hypothetical protein